MVRNTNAFGTGKETGTEIAIEGAVHQLQFYWNLDTQPTTWNLNTVAGPGTTYSAPAMVRFTNTLGTGTEITAQG
jgi:hypothetical protein